MKPIKENTEKPDIQNLLDILHKGGNWKDVQPLMDASGSTYAQDAVDNADDYYEAWEGSSNYRDRVKSSLFDQVGNDNLNDWIIARDLPHLLADVERSLDTSRPENQKKQSREKDLKERANNIQNSLAFKYSDPDEFLIISHNRKKLKEKLKEAGINAPKIKGMSKHDSRLFLLGQMVEDFKRESTDKVVEYKNMLRERNPLQIQTGNRLQLKGPWRPEEDLDGGVQTENVRGASGIVNANIQSGGDPEAYRFAKDADGNTVEFPVNRPDAAPLIMGMPRSFQETWKPGAAQLYSDPRQLEETIVHEKSHITDTTGRSTNYMSEVVNASERIDDPRDKNAAFNDYIASPSETNARIQVLRKHLYSAGVDVFNEPIDFVKNPDTYRFLQENSDSSALRDLKDVYSIEDIQRMLNSLI
mgnify:CR=1 FL=1|tara:strand:- start:1140 stop:2387 length:1248 start_codon:yes stop_codon:yes gene_type:complete